MTYHTRRIPREGGNQVVLRAKPVRPQSTKEGRGEKKRGKGERREGEEDDTIISTMTSAS